MLKHRNVRFKRIDAVEIDRSVEKLWDSSSCNSVFDRWFVRGLLEVVVDFTFVWVTRHNVWPK